MAKGFLLLVLSMSVSTENWRGIQGEDYIIAIATSEGHPRLHPATGDKWGWMQIQQETRKNLGSFTISTSPFNNSMETTSGIENKSVPVVTSDTVLNLYARVHDFYSYFSPLPTSALGTKYIVSSCHPTGNYTSVVVIASHRHGTDINVTFTTEGSVHIDGINYQNGNTLAMKLNKHQTFTVNSNFDLSGSTITATETVAVFSGTLHRNVLVAYDQLLPVEHHGQEYVVAVGKDADEFEVQIISEHKDIQIGFTNGYTVSLGESQIFRQRLDQNENLYFSTTKPAMTTVCRKNELNSGFVVVPPISAHRKRSVIYMDEGNIAKVFTQAETVDIQVVEVEHFPKSRVPIVWKDIPGSDFKVGTCSSPKNSSYLLSSDSNPFGLIVYRPVCIYNGGYNLSSENLRTSVLKVPQTTMTVVVGAVCGCVILILLFVLTALAVQVGRKRDNVSASHKEKGQVSTSIHSLAVISDVTNDSQPDDLRVESTTDNDYDKIS